MADQQLQESESHVSIDVRVDFRGMVGYPGTLELGDGRMVLKVAKAVMPDITIRTSDVVPRSEAEALAEALEALRGEVGTDMRYIARDCEMAVNAALDAYRFRHPKEQP